MERVVDRDVRANILHTHARVIIFFTDRPTCQSFMHSETERARIMRLPFLMHLRRREMISTSTGGSAAGGMAIHSLFSREGNCWYE